MSCPVAYPALCAFDLQEALWADEETTSLIELKHTFKDQEPSIHIARIRAFYAIEFAMLHTMRRYSLMQLTDIFDDRSWPKYKEQQVLFGIREQLSSISPLPKTHEGLTEGLTLVAALRETVMVEAAAVKLKLSTRNAPIPPALSLALDFIETKMKLLRTSLITCELPKQFGDTFGCFLKLSFSLVPPTQVFQDLSVVSPYNIIHPKLSGKQITYSWV